MSLIQDALKRKLEEEQFLPPKEKPAVAPAAAPVPTPAPAKAPAPDSTKLLLILVVIIVLLLIGLGVYLLLRPATESVATSRPAPVVVTAQPVVEEPEVVEEPAPVIEKEPAPPPGVQWPKLSLTGFASGGTERLVIINGKMLSTGSRIEGVRILQIGNREVAVEYQGEQRMLRVDNQ